jgi:hypothetical protein
MWWMDEIAGLDRAKWYLAGDPLPATARILRLSGVKKLAGLGDVKGVRTLWVDRAPAGELARLGELAPNVETLIVGGERVTDLGYLSGVGTPGKVVLFDHTKLERLDGIEALRSVSSLTLDNFPRVSDLGPLAALGDLEHLALSTSLSRAVNGNRHLVDSLAPLRHLRSLERLSCFAVVARDRDLTPLHSLPKLADVDLPLVYSTEQTARLGGALGLDAERWPAVEPVTGDCAFPCGRCGSRDRVMLVGTKRRSFVCRHCESERVERHVEEFEAWRARGAD